MYYVKSILRTIISVAQEYNSSRVSDKIYKINFIREIKRYVKYFKTMIDPSAGIIRKTFELKKHIFLGWEIMDTTCIIIFTMS